MDTDEAIPTLGMTFADYEELTTFIDRYVSYLFDILFL